MPNVDMSPDAVYRRLQQVSDLRDACLLLAGPRWKKPWGTERFDLHRHVAHDPRATVPGYSPERPTSNQSS